MNIGSNCIKHYFKDFNREPKDIDFINHYKLKNTKVYQDALLIDKRVEILDNPVLIDYIFNKYGSIPEYCPINELYTLKISHVVGWDLENKSWDKHIWDIQFLKEKGCIFVEDLFYELYEYWNKVHGKNKRSQLDMSAEDFFNNAVKFPIPHDQIHELLIMHPYFEDQPEPTYKKILIGEVDVCMSKFNELSEKEKFNTALEEIMVMQMERYSNMYYKKGFIIMLKKFIINHAKLEEALWIVQNHKYLVCNIPFNHIDFLNNKLCQLIQEEK